MADSRFANVRFFLRKKWPLTHKLSLLIGVFLMAFLITGWARTEGLNAQTSHALFLLLFAGGLWITEAIPPFAVSILIIGFAIYFLDNLRPAIISQEWEKYLSTWSSPIIWILIGGFFLAIGAPITQFDRKFSHLVLSRFGANP